MHSIVEWTIARKHKKKMKEKETKEKRKSLTNKKITEEKQKKAGEEMKRVENFVDENIQEAFDTLAIYQKCLEDEKKRWVRFRKDITETNASAVVKNLRKVRYFSLGTYRYLINQALRIQILHGSTSLFVDPDQKPREQSEPDSHHTVSSHSIESL